MVKKADIFEVTGKHHICSVCNKFELWGDSWQWYGSYADLDGGPYTKNYKPQPIVKTCSDECRGRATDLGMVPRD